MQSTEDQHHESHSLHLRTNLQWRLFQKRLPLLQNPALRRRHQTMPEDQHSCWFTEKLTYQITFPMEILITWLFSMIIWLVVLATRFLQFVCNWYVQYSTVQRVAEDGILRLESVTLVLHSSHGSIQWLHSNVYRCVLPYYRFSYLSKLEVV